jgi:hypothetical protein
MEEWKAENAQVQIIIPSNATLKLHSYRLPVL